MDRILEFHRLRAAHGTRVLERVEKNGKFALHELIDLVEVFRFGPVGVRVVPAELVRPCNDSSYFHAGIAAVAESSGAALVGDIGQRLGIVVQADAARNLYRLFGGEDSDGLGEEAVQDIITQQNGFFARDAGHGGFVSVDK